MHLAERPGEVGDVVKNRVAAHEVERLVGERQALGLRANPRDLEVNATRRPLERVEHALRDVGRGGALDRAELEHVEAEIAGSGADLERVAERLGGQGTEGLFELRAHLRLADFAEVDAPPQGVFGGRGGGGAGVCGLYFFWG